MSWMNANLRCTRTRPTLGRLGYRSLLAVPLLREDRIMGGLTIYRRSTGSFLNRSCESPSDLCNAVSSGDPKRPAVPGNRG